MNKSTGSMRGVICVERSVRGVIEWLPLADQHHYREWQGCFSLLGNQHLTIVR